MTFPRKRLVGAVFGSLLGCALLTAPVMAASHGSGASGARNTAQSGTGVLNAVDGEWRLCSYAGEHPPELAEGHANDAVGHLQCVLNRVYGYTSVDIDKIFGPATRTAVVDFQRSVGLTADGFVGPRTWAALHP